MIKEYKVVKVELSEDISHFVVMDSDNAKIVDCGQFNSYEAEGIARTLNKDHQVICWSYWNEDIGTAVLSEMYKNGYQILTHTTTLYDGEIINNVILHKQPRGMVDM